MWAASVRVFADGFAEPVGETTTDRNGQFSVEVLAGAYRIRVSAPAFRAVDRLVHAVPGLEPLAVTLALEGLEESVDVVDTAGEFAIDALSSLTATTLSGDELLGLPADEEDLALYLLLLAGADSTGDLEDDVSGFIIDGFDEGRLPRPEEIAQIIIDPTPLRAAGVGEGPRIEIITRPGTGRWRRSASFDFSDESLDATTPGDRTKPARQTRNVDLDLRGPILPGRLDVDVEASTNRQQRVADSLRAITPAGNVFDGVVRPRREHEPELDADIEVASNRSMGVRLDYESRRTENSGVGGFTLAERGTSDARRDWSLQVSERRLGEAFVNDLRVRMRRRGSSAAPVSEGVAIDVADAFNRGGGTRRNLDEETRIQVEDRLRVPGSVSGGRAIIDERRTSLYRLDPDYRSPYSVNPQFNVTQQLPGGLRLSVSYRLRPGRQQRIRNINAPFPGTPLAPEILMLPRDVRLETVDRMRPFYPNVGNIYQIESTGRSVGRRFRVRLERRRSLQVAGIGLSGSLNYSYRSGEDDDDFNNPYLPAWGLARLEHRVQSQFRVRLPRDAGLTHPFLKALARATYEGTAFNFNLRANSGRPYSIRSGRDLNGDQSTRDRPSGVARNTETGPARINLDMTFTKEFRPRATDLAQAGGAGASGPASLVRDPERHPRAAGPLRARSGGPVDLERPSDAVAGDVFERRRRDELVLAGLPRRPRREDPARLLALHAEFPIQRPAAAGRHPQRALQQAVVQRRGEDDCEGVPGALDRDLQAPAGRVQRALPGRSHAELAAERRDERLALGVAPVRIDLERVRAARRQRPTQLLVRQDAALDAARIVEDGEPRAVLVP